MAATSSNQELLRWRKQLADFRQPWSEWEQLEQIANQEAFTLEADDDVPFPNQFLAGPRGARGYRIIRNVLTEAQEAQFREAVAGNSIFPQYMVGLLDLKYSDSSMMAGGIGGRLCPLSIELDFQLPLPLGPDICLSDPYVIYNKNPSDVVWPKLATFPFQTNSSGATFFLDERGDVSAFSSKRNEFARVGSITDYIRFCLSATLGGQDWYRNYSKQINLKEFNLEFLDDVGID